MEANTFSIKENSISTKARRN